MNEYSNSQTTEDYVDDITTQFLELIWNEQENFYREAVVVSKEASIN